MYSFFENLRFVFKPIHLEHTYPETLQSPNAPSSYCPVLLLSSVFKMLEILIHNKIKKKIDIPLSPTQQGFRPKHHCYIAHKPHTTYFGWLQLITTPLPHNTSGNRYQESIWHFPKIPLHKRYLTQTPTEMTKMVG